MDLLGLLYPFAHEVGIDPVFERQARYRDAGAEGNHFNLSRSFSRSVDTTHLFSDVRIFCDDLAAAHIEERYVAFFRDEYMRLLHLSQEARDLGLDIAEDIPTFLRLYRKKAVNLWPHIVYAAVLADDELIEYLRTGDLPENL